MDFKETLASFVRPAFRPQEQALHAALEAARQAKYAEDYDQALAQLDHALELARSSGDLTSEIAVLLNRTEIFMRQARYADAEALLAQVVSSARDDTQRSYTQTMVGMVAQAQGDWITARAAYERALTYARAAKAESAEGRALGRLADTYLHDANASYAIHLLRDSLPKLSSSGDVEPSSYFTGLLGQALIQSGQESEGQNLLERALRIAEQLHYRGYERYWALLLGDRAFDEGRYPEAHAYYAHLLRLFPPETETVDYVIAVTRMSRACLSLRKPDEALSYAQIGFNIAQKLDDASLLRRAQGALGIALRALGHSSDAISHLQAAALDTAVGEDVQVDVLRSLAAAQADSGDTEGAVATYQRAISHAADKTIEMAQARRDLGLVYQQRKELQPAINEWTAALAIYDELRAYSQVARLYSDIGGARKALGQRGRAMKDYEQALMILNSLNGDQETRGLVLSNAANAYAEQGDVESADAFFTEAISIAERLSDPVAETTRNGNYGWFLLLVGRPRRAIATLERALAISQPRNLALPAAVQLNNLGLVYDALADYPAALERHRQALALVADSVWAGQIKVSLAHTLIALNQLDEAQPLIDEALAEGRQNENGELILLALTEQARLLIAREQPAAAEDALTDALALARKLDNRRLIAEALSVRSQQQAALGSDDGASSAWDEAQKLYAMLHMPQAKIQPAWLTRTTTRT